MRVYPRTEEELKEVVEEYGIKEWQLESIKKNPDYPHWGNNEGMMRTASNPWDKSMVIDFVDELWEIDELNELVNFYFNFDEEEDTFGLQMWFIHPRRGTSRGVYLVNIQEEELPRVIDYLKQARDRNNERFSKL